MLFHENNKEGFLQKLLLSQLKVRILFNESQNN